MTETGKRPAPWPLILLFASFLVPAAIAWTMFFTGWHPSGTANHGDLIQPPHHLEGELRDIDGAAVDRNRFRGRWTILMVHDGACAEACIERLRETRQVRLALAQNADRVRRVLVLPAGAEPPENAVLEDNQDLRVVFGENPIPDAAHGGNGMSLSLMDTRAYRMMAYPEPLDAGGLLQDLKKLLRLSNIDLERLQGLSEDD
ncbi:hypothetical protein M0534_11375 [Methylonatrum kenyense]|uniref:hypothetical protein n=1 Tax=Methylonatrum kenyense TaxID=455253 RepID=UPI0020BF3205|nr:hypothetical protein [Methylonatrum kenyense]MCK8516920.1 hypothetical protein [Methylonatrum kenyense]